MYLALPALELVQQGLGLGADVELGVVVHEDDEVRVVDEPLARVVEGVAAVDLADGAGLQHSGDLGEGGLQSDVLIDKRVLFSHTSMDTSAVSTRGQFLVHY